MLAVSSDGTHVWATDELAAEIDATTGVIISSTTPVGNGPVYLSADGTHVWVSNHDDNTVTEILP